MTFVICNRRAWKAKAFLEVAEISDGDLKAFQNHIQALFTEIFKEEPED